MFCSKYLTGNAYKVRAYKLAIENVNKGRDNRQRTIDLQTLCVLCVGSRSVAFFKMVFTKNSFFLSA